MIKIRGKKGGEKYLSIWWFFVLIIIAGAIVIAVSAFNIADVSTKEIESDILVNRFVDCVIDAGYINKDFLKGDFDVFKRCYLSKEGIEDKEHYLGYEVYNFDDCKVADGKLNCENPVISNSFGILNYEKECDFKGEHMPQCSEKYIYVLNKEGGKLIMRVKGGSNQVIKQEREIK